MKQRQYMMDRYMGMQQQMMDHMMQHQNYMWMQPPRWGCGSGRESAGRGFKPDRWPSGLFPRSRQTLRPTRVGSPSAADNERWLYLTAW